MNEERLKEMRNLLVLNPDDELSDFLTHTDLIDLIDELLSLRKSEGDEDVALIAERFQCGETEFHKIQAYKDLEGVAIARGQQLREAQAEVERLKGELAEVVGRLVWMHKTFSGTDEYRYLKEDGYREIGRIELAVKNQLEIVAASDGKSESEVGR